MLALLQEDGRVVWKWWWTECRGSDFVLDQTLPVNETTAGNLRLLNRIALRKGLSLASTAPIAGLNVAHCATVVCQFLFAFWIAEGKEGRKNAVTAMGRLTSL